MLEPFWHHQAAVRQQAVIAQGDTHSVERNAQNRQRHSRPAKQPGNECGECAEVNDGDRNQSTEITRTNPTVAARRGGRVIVRDGRSAWCDLRDGGRGGYVQRHLGV